MARPSQDFIERALELQGTVRARASAAETAWAVRSAAHTGEDAFDALAKRVTSSPVRVAGVLSGEHDPLLLCALAGKRSMEDLAGVAPAGGRSNAAPTMLESLAARRVQQHWDLCRTDPVDAKRLEAKWAASRATMRAGHLGPALSAMEATYGAACSVEREAAQGRLVSTVPPASWDPAGAHAGKLAGYGSERWNRMRGQAVAETQMPADWEHRRSASRGRQRPRARFVARGAGRVEQLADARFSLRMAASRIAFQVRLKLAMARGPGATRRFLTSVASNPRRAAAAVRARLDPMVVAAAIGPKAIEGMLAGRHVREAGPLGRLQDELQKRDVARLQHVRTGPDGGGVADLKAQRDALDGGLASAKGMREASARFVDKVWQGDNRAGAAGGGWSADSALGEQFQQGRVDGSVYDAWRGRREAVVEGAGAEQLQERFGAERWSPVDSALQDRAGEEALSERFAELGGADAGYRLRREVVVAANPQAGIDQVEALHVERRDLRAARGEAAADSRAETDWAAGDIERGPGGSGPGGSPGEPLSQPTVPPVPDGPVPAEDRDAVLNGQRLRVESELRREDSAVFGEGVTADSLRGGPDWIVRADGACVHRTADVADDARIEAGAIVGPKATVESGAVVREGARVGADAEIGKDAIVDRDVLVGGSRVGSGAVVGFGSVVAGWSHVEAGALVGSGSVVGSGVKIGSNAWVGAGTSVGERAKIGARAEVGANCVIAGPTRGVKNRATGHEAVEIGDGAGIANGVKVGSAALVMTQSQVGAGAWINDGAALHPTTKIGEDAVVGINADVAFGVEVPERVLVLPEAEVTKENVSRLSQAGYRGVPDDSSAEHEWASVATAFGDEDKEKLKERFASLGGRDAGYRLRTEVTELRDPGGTWSSEREVLHLERWQPRARSQDEHPSPPGVGSSQVPGASIVIPPEALRDVEVKEEDLPKMTQEAEPPPNGSWKVHDDDLVDRVIPREDGSYEVQFKPGVVPAQGLGEDAASETHKRRTDPQLVELQNERTAQTVDLERAARETLADAVEHGRAPFDVERAGYMPGVATNAFSREPVDGVDGDLLRAKAIREGAGHDLRFATREQIEAAGGRVSPEAEGVIVMREVPVSAQPFGADGKVDRKADSVDYRVKSPQVLYHVSTETDLVRGQVPSQPLGARVPEMTAEDLCKSVGVNTLEMGHPKGRSEFRPANPKDNVPEDTIVVAKDGGESVAERNGRLAGAAVRAMLSSNRDENDSRPAAPKDAYSKDAGKAKLERRLVEVMAADRAAGRIGVAYRTSPPVTAKERKEFVQMLKKPEVRERLGKEVDRVSFWVADGAKERLQARGVDTVHERAQGASPAGADRGRPDRQRDEPAYSR